MRVHKVTQKVVYVDPFGSSANCATTGDTIISVDNKEIRDSKTLQRVMRELATVCIHVNDAIQPDDSDWLGLSVSYDARERLQVASIKRWGLAAVHLRLGDTIKEVSGHPVVSKSMLRFWLLDSMEKNGFVELLIQGNIDQSNVYDYELEMPDDVLAITARQIAIQRTVSSEQLHGIKTILRKGLPLPKHQISLTICDDIAEVPIGCDFDPKHLHKVKKGEAVEKIK